MGFWVAVANLGDAFLVLLSFIPQQQNALGSSAIVMVSEKTGAAQKPIPQRFPGSK
jgi:hypothetical protein